MTLSTQQICTLCVRVSGQTGFRPYGLAEFRRPLLAGCDLETQVATEEWHHVILKAISYLVGMIALIQLEAIGDAILIKHIVQLL